MKTSFDLFLESGHLFAGIGGKTALVDTGGPTSFGDIGSIEVCEKTHSIESQFMGMSPQDLSQYLGAEIDMLLGADLLSSHLVTIDLASGFLQFELSGSREISGEVVAVQDIMGIPIIRIEVAQQERSVFFDTGASTSYLDSSITDGWERVGVVEDFYPGFGAFTTETYRLDYKLGQFQSEEKFGNLPDVLGLLVQMDREVVGILGNAFIQKGVVTLDTQAGKMGFIE